MSSIKIKSS